MHLWPQMRKTVQTAVCGLDGFQACWGSAPIPGEHKMCSETQSERLRLRDFSNRYFSQVFLLEPNRENLTTTVSELTIVLVFPLQIGQWIQRDSVCSLFIIELFRQYLLCIIRLAFNNCFLNLWYVSSHICRLLLEAFQMQHLLHGWEHLLEIPSYQGLCYSFHRSPGVQ